jgi:hypothetical protein
MADDVDGIIVLIGHCWDEVHHVENQRSTLTNIILLSESATLALIVERGFTPNTIPLSVLLVVLGIFGIVATKKYYERYRFAQRRLEEFYKRLSRMLPSAKIWESLRKANIAHDCDPHVQIGSWHLKKLALNRMWSLIHVAFVLAGLGLYVLTVVGFTWK